MTTLVSSIIAEACGSLGQPPPADTVFDNSTNDQDALVMRSEFRFWYRDLVNMQVEDFKKEADVDTVAGQKTYTLPAGLSGLDISDIQNVRYISVDPGASYWLNYWSEKQIERMYPNIEDIPQGKVTGWFLNTRATAGTKELRFYLTPDAVYKIRFYLNELPTNLRAADLTGCNRFGDEYLIRRMKAVLAKHWFGEESLKAAEAEADAQKFLKKYKLKRWNNSEYNRVISPQIAQDATYQFTDINPRY